MRHVEGILLYSYLLKSVNIQYMQPYNFSTGGLLEITSAHCLPAAGYGGRQEVFFEKWPTSYHAAST